MLYAFLATFISAVSLVAHKFTLSNLKVNSRVFNLVVFIFLAGTALIWAYFNNTFPDKSFFEGFSLLLFVAVVFIAFAWNALFSYALQKEQMPEAEIIIALSPILTIMLALMFLPEERNLAILIPAFIAGAALVWANIGKHHFYFSRSEQILLIAVLGIATETILIKHLLSFIAAEALYALRCFFTLPFLPY